MKRKLMVYLSTLVFVFMAGLVLIYRWRGQDRTRDKSCQPTYAAFYHADRIDIRLVFGYKDTRPARFVGDRYERAYVAQEMIKLGFKRSLQDDDLFERKVNGPDGREKTVALRLVHSSVSADDQENREDPFQKWQSNYAEGVFLQGLRSADAVFYNGHSRTGGGPDFTPPLRTADGHVDYDWYQRNQPGYKKLIEALQVATHAPKLLGLLSCVADEHFARGILAVGRGTGLLASDSLLYYWDSLQDSVESIRDLVEMKCRGDFHPTGTRMLGFLPAEEP